MKKRIFIVICTLSLMVCNMRTVYGAISANTVNTSYGSYSYETFSGKVATIPYFNITIGANMGAYVMIYNFNKTYTGDVTFYFNNQVKSYDWYLVSFGGTIDFDESATVYRMHLHLDGCNGFAVMVVGDSSAANLTLDVNYNTSYSLTEVQSVQSTVSDIKGKVNNIDILMSLISSNVNSIKGYVDGLEGQLTNISGNTDGVESSLDSIKGYTDNLESLLTTIASNTGVQNGISLIQTMSDLIGLLSSTVGDNTVSLFDVVDGLLNTANSIKALFDSNNLDNTDVVNSINSLSAIVDSHLSNIPQVSWNAYYYFGSFNVTKSNSWYGGYLQYIISDTRSDDYNYNRRVSIQPNSKYVISFRANFNFTNNNFVMYKSDSNADIIVSNFDTGISSNRIETFVISNNTDSVQSVSFDIVLDNSVTIVPYYVGQLTLMTHEMQLITQYFVSNDINYNSSLEQIIDLLGELGIKFDSFDFDGTELVNAINDLYNAINQLSSNINITNNITLSELPISSWNAYYYFGSFNVTKSNSWYGGYLQYVISETRSDQYYYNRRVSLQPNSKYVISFRANTNMTNNNFVMYKENSSADISVINYDSVISANRIETFVISNNTNSVQSVSFDLITSVNLTVIPYYVGPLELMTSEVQMITHYYTGMTADESLRAIFSILSNNQLAFQDMMNEINLIQTSLGLDLNAMLNTFLTDFNINIGKLLDMDIDIESLFDKLLEIDLDSLVNFDVNIDLNVLNELTVAIGQYLNSINDEVVNYHDIWLQQYDLLDLDTKLTVPQEITSGASSIGYMFESVISSDGTMQFLVYSSLSIGLFGLYLGLKREK